MLAAAADREAAKITVTGPGNFRRESQRARQLDTDPHPDQRRNQRHRGRFARRYGRRKSPLFETVFRAYQGTRHFRHRVAARQWPSRRSSKPSPGGAAVALSGIEQCLWDIRGKVVGVPAYDLFGGMLHPKIRNYANINRSTEDRDAGGLRQHGRAGDRRRIRRGEARAFRRYAARSLERRAGGGVHQDGNRARRRRAPGDRAAGAICWWTSTAISIWIAACSFARGWST